MRARSGPGCRRARAHPGPPTAPRSSAVVDASPRAGRGRRPSTAPRAGRPRSPPRSRSRDRRRRTGPGWSNRPDRSGKGSAALTPDRLPADATIRTRRSCRGDHGRLEARTIASPHAPLTRPRGRWPARSGRAGGAGSRSGRDPTQRLVLPARGRARRSTRAAAVGRGAHAGDATQNAFTLVLGVFDRVSWQDAGRSTNRRDHELLDEAAGEGVLRRGGGTWSRSRLPLPVPLRVSWQFWHARRRCVRMWNSRSRQSSACPSPSSGRRSRHVSAASARALEWRGGRGTAGRLASRLNGLVSGVYFEVVEAGHTRV